MIPASNYGQDDIRSDIGDISGEEQALVEQIYIIWESILSITIEDTTDFFKSGAGSMDVTRLVEEIRELSGYEALELINEDVYMATTFDEFTKLVVLKSRGGSNTPKLVFNPIQLNANKRDISFPNQLFINNQFINSSNPERVLKIINPNDESLICEVQSATKEDVDKAVNAAVAAFETGEWANMNARDRGKLLYRLADLMEQYKEELATIESIDSGAVYTLAIKTHIGLYLIKVFFI
jgi:formyltetrahydrofolate dehydrogenase